MPDESHDLPLRIDRKAAVSSSIVNDGMHAFEKVVLNNSDRKSGQEK